MIPERIEKNGVLQGYTVWSETPIVLLTYDETYYYNKAVYRGHCSVGVIHQTVECVAVDSIEAANLYISENGLVKYDGTLTEWHESTSKRIIMSLQDKAEMLRHVPELAVYLKENNIQSYIEGGFIYIYVNFLYEEHEAILLNYNAIIQDGTTN